MEKLTTIFTCFLLLIVSVAKSQELTLQGILIGVEDGTEIRINPYLENGAVDMDDQTSIFLKNGKFEYTRKLNRPTKFSLRTMPKIPPDNLLDYEFCYFWTENRQMTFKGIKGEILLCKVSGSSIHKQYEKMILEIADNNKKSRELFEYAINNKPNLSEKEIKEIRIQRKHYTKEIEKKKHEFILQHPEYYFAGEEIVFYINHFAHAFSKNEINEFYNRMPSELKSGIYGKQIADFLENKVDYNTIVPLQIGDKPHDFTLFDSKNNSVTFSKINGKIILLDFWGSGCSPCRKEHINYAELYKKYKNEGFEIVSVSQDRSKKRWLSAMEKDKMNWVSLLDADANLSRINYLVTVLPTNFLINEKGIIIAKNLRGSTLKNRLEEIFDNK